MAPRCLIKDEVQAYYHGPKASAVSLAHLPSLLPAFIPFIPQAYDALLLGPPRNAACSLTHLCCHSPGLSLLSLPPPPILVGDMLMFIFFDSIQASFLRKTSLAPPSQKLS